MAKNKITEISGHDVSWFVNSKSVNELSEIEIERIAELIKEGINQGQICMSYCGKNNVDYETTGWWSIINWRDIATELRNSIESGSITNSQLKAIKRFDDEWVF